MNLMHKQHQLTTLMENKGASFGLLGVNICFKNQSNGMMEKTIGVCKLCKKELAIC